MMVAPGTADQPTSFVGRAEELGTVAALVRRERLVTLTGPAGAGKSRLAITVADRLGADFPHGVALAELPAGQPDYLTQAVATALGVTERPGQPLPEALYEPLRAGRGLLILDHCQPHHAETAALAVRLLANCPELTILATARSPLDLDPERALPLGSLGTDAETLLRDRLGPLAEAMDTELAGRLCGIADGLPLAIELIAAQAGTVGRTGLRALAEGSSRSPLAAVIGWSHDQIDADAQRLLRRLGVFVAGFDRAAAGQVGAQPDPAVVAELLDRLTNRGLLVRVTRPAGQTGPAGQRWRLVGPIREHAVARLAAAGEAPLGRDLHREWAATTVRELAQRAEADQPWRAEFAMVANDLRLAVRDTPGPHPQAHQLARDLARLAYGQQFLLEARQTFQRAATRTDDDREAAADLRAAANVAMTEHRGEPAFALLQESARRAHRAGDQAGEAIALAGAVCIANRFPATFTELVPHQHLCRLLATADRCTVTGDRLVTAHLAAAHAWNANGEKTNPDPELTQVALAAARAAGDPMLVSAALDAVTSADGAAGRFRDAHRVSRERVQLFDRLPRLDPRIGVEIIDILHVAPLVAVAAGDLPGAVTAAHRAWADPLSGLYMRASKFLAPLVLSGRFAEALEYADTMWHGWLRVGRPTARWMAPAVHSAALAHGLAGRTEQHREWLDRARHMSEPGGHSGIADSFAAFAEPRRCLHTGAIDDALAGAVDLAAEPAWSDSGHQFFDAYGWAVAAEVAVVAGLPDAAHRLARAQPAGGQNSWATACLARATGRLTGDQDALRASVAGWERIDSRFERAITLLLLPDRAAEGRAELTALGTPAPAQPVTSHPARRSATPSQRLPLARGGTHR
jgi:predicted ATPase